MKNVLLVQKIVPKWRAELYRKLSFYFLLEGWKLNIVYDFYSKSINNHKSCGRIAGVECTHKKLINLSQEDYLLSVKDTLEDIKPEIVITNANPRFITSSELIYRKKIFKYKLFGWSSGFFRNKNIIADYLRKLYFLKFDGIIAYHSKAKEIFNRHYKHQFVLNAGNGIDENSIEEEINHYKSEELDHFKKSLVKNSSILILFVGKITKTKKLYLLLNVAKRVGEKYRFVIIGDGPEYDTLKKDVFRENIKNVIFLGRIEKGVNKYFQIADIFILPGLGGLALIQALHNGLPIISTPGDGIGYDAIVNGYNGFISEDLNEEKIEKFLNILEKKETRIIFGKRSKEIASNFTLDNIAKKIVRFVTN